MIQTLPSSGLTNFIAPASDSPTGVYKITNNNGQALFIKVSDPAWTGYDWQSNSPSAVQCATSDSPSWKQTTAAVNCNVKGVRTHTCGYGNGWIMFHNGETYGSNNPCKIGQTTNNGWGRGQFVNVYSCDSFAPQQTADACTSWTPVQTLPSSGLTNFIAPASNSPTGVYKITNNNNQ